MPLLTDLEEAGRRAARQPVRNAPPVAALQAQASHHQSQRRLMSAAVVGVLVMALGVPLLLGLGRATEVQTVAAGAVAPGIAAVNQAAQQDDSAATAQAAQQDEQDQAPEETDRSGEQTGTAQFEIRFGDLVFTVRVLDGAGATEAGAKAQAGADETQDR